MKKPFTPEESEIMDLLVSAHNKFLKLERMHPSEIEEWVLNFHNLQYVLSMRILQRDYPKYFITRKP